MMSCSGIFLECCKALSVPSPPTAGRGGGGGAGGGGALREKERPPTRLAPLATLRAARFARGGRDACGLTSAVQLVGGGPTDRQVACLAQPFQRHWLARRLQLTLGSG